MRTTRGLRSQRSARVARVPGVRARIGVASVLLALVGLLPSPALGGFPLLLVFPGGCRQPDNGLLQNCINTANSGDGIQIRTNTIDEHITIQDMSLALTAGAGFHPNIVQGAQIGTSAGTYSVSITGIVFNAPVAVALDGGSGHTLTFNKVRITVSTVINNMYPPALSIESMVPASMSLTRSVISNTSDFGSGVSLEAQNSTGRALFRLVGNRISGSAKSGGGLGFDGFGGGTVHLGLYNNVIQKFNCDSCLSRGGTPSVIGISAEGTSHVLVNIVGNTIDHGGFPALRVVDAVEQSGSAQGTLTVNAFNNVFSNQKSSAIRLDSSASWGPTSLTFHAGRNDYYAIGQPNVLGGYSLGSGNLHLAPKYVSATTGNLRLQASSPLINRGVVCSPGGVADPDAAGHHRLAGASVDLGAYEYGAVTPTGVVLVGNGAADPLIGTDGADILCGMGGADLLKGMGGADYLDGGSGADEIVGGGGPDRLFGRSGADTLCAVDGHGNDHLFGGAGTDAYKADPGDSLNGVEVHAVC